MRRLRRLRQLRRVRQLQRIKWFEFAEQYAAKRHTRDGQGDFTVVNDVDPAADVCSSTTDQARMSGKNIGDLLNASNVTWGNFMGGFNLSTTNSNGTTGCNRSTHSSVTASTSADYIPHHNGFQYFASTANPKHARPNSTAAIGYTVQPGSTTPDPANHQYDIDDFFGAVSAGDFPSVSFARIRTAMPATRTRSTSKLSSRRSSTSFSNNPLGRTRR
jgi:phospholipase C